MPILIVGSIALDSIRTPFGEVKDSLGGSAVYAACAASYFAHTGIVGVVGGDFPERHMFFLRGRNIDLAGLQQMPGGKTFCWKGHYDYDLNQAFTEETRLNVFEDFNPAIPQSYRDFDYVFLANIDPEIQLKVFDQVRRPKVVLCDTMNYWIEQKRDALEAVFRRSDIVQLTDAEARQYCATPNLKAAAQEILELGPARVIIKKGQHGCLMFGGNETFSTPGFPLERVKDPTGAGDTFSGGLIGYLARSSATLAKEEIPEEMLRSGVIVGSVLASYTAEQFSLDKLQSLVPIDISGRYNHLLEITRFQKLDSDDWEI